MTRPPDALEAVEAALRRWLAESELRSHDPYDGLSGALPGRWLLRWPLAARTCMQVVKRSPVNLRPVLGIPPRVLSKSLADVASAALLRHRIDADEAASAEARALRVRLRAEALSGWSGACWALATPYVTRFIRSPGGDPNLFWTIGAAVTFLEAFEQEGQAADLDIARSAVEFILRDLGVVDEGESGVWFRYFPGHEAAVYNVAALGGALLQRVGRWTGEDDLVALGGRALRFVAGAQNPDGSWFYARGDAGRWVDGFHTGYVLESLLQAVLQGSDATLQPVLRRGLEFYLEHLFTPDDVPRYAAHSTFPIEVQNCAQAIQTLSRLAWLDASFVPRAERVATAVVARLFRWTRRQEPAAGYFILNRGRWFCDRLPAIRWGEAPMLLALTSLRAARVGLRPAWERIRAEA